MCCAWLLYAREADDAEDALTLFGLERTDLSQGLRKIQGVDTPSQRRYVHQLNALLREQGAYLTPERAPEVGARALAELEREDSPLRSVAQAVAAEIAVTGPDFPQKPTCGQLAAGAPLCHAGGHVRVRAERDVDVGRARRWGGHSFVPLCPSVRRTAKRRGSCIQTKTATRMRPVHM